MSAPALISVDVNYGVPFANPVQRSQIVAVQINFDQAATILADAFTLENTGLFTPGSNLLPSSAIKYTPGNANSVLLTFDAGPVAQGLINDGVVKRNGPAAAVNGDSLANGTYKLTIDPAKVFNNDGNLAGDNQFGEAYSDKFFRMFGDSDGDGDVDGTDTVAFRRAQVAYNAALDWDGNGSVTIGTDSTNFASNSSKKRRVF